MERVYCFLGSEPAALVTVSLGFLGVSLFRYESQAFELLDSLGFPWNLSSESRLFNGLRRIHLGIFFLRLCPRVGGESLRMACEQGGVGHRASLD
jgi:hypothetical protein